MTYKGDERRQKIDNTAIYHKLGGMEEKLDTCIQHISICEARHKASEQYIHDQKLYGRAGAWIAASMFSVGAFFLSYGDKIKDYLREWLK